MKIKSTSLITVLALTASAFIAQGQDQKPPDGNRSREGGGDRSRGIEEFRQRMADRLKTSLKVSDDEWGIIQPLIEKVQTKLRDSMGSRFGGSGGPGGSSRGPGGGDGGRPGGEGGRPGGEGGRPGGDGGRGGGSPSAGSSEREALRTALENENASPEELKAKLNAVREVRKKGAAELAEAREELKKVLTVRQEAALVAYGILE